MNLTVYEDSLSSNKLLHQTGTLQEQTKIMHSQNQYLRQAKLVHYASQSINIICWKASEYNKHAKPFQ